MADDDVTSASSSTLKVDGAKYDLNALFGFTVLQDLLRSLSKQQDHQLELIQQLREDLEAEKRNGEEVAKRLKAEIDLKATEKALTALALETSRDKTAMQKKHETFESEVSKKFAKHEQRLETQQSKLYDCKVSLDTKAETRTLDALTTRVDGCATAVELADAKLALRTRIDEVEKASTARHEAAEVQLEVHASRLTALEGHSKTLATKDEMANLEKRSQEADQAQREETKAVEKRGAANLSEATRVLEARHVRAEETLERHWSHIRNVEELVRTKADREMVQQGIDKAAADTAAVDAKFTTITSEHIAKMDVYMDKSDARLDSSETRLDEVESGLKTKATLDETRELREKVALCSLRTEMRELLEGLRQETSSRVRILKERLDRTDRELLRQLEDAQNNDRADKFDALAAIVETKADKALTERWLEASQQLHGELQTVHVRTQTLGQGMKVVLGWVEGMADKVTGLQAGQNRMQQQVASAREEQQFALNATARETITKVKGMLSQQPAAGPPLPSPRGAFEAAKPLSRPTTSEGRGGPVVLKAAGSAAADAMPAADLDGPGFGHAFGSSLESSALAGPAGAALAGAVPLTGVMGKAALERLASEPVSGGEFSPRPSTDHAPFRNETERRKHALDAKRRDLVEARMRPQPTGSHDIGEPRPPSHPRPDPTLGSAHGISPRRLEIEGGPPASA